MLQMITSRSISVDLMGTCGSDKKHSKEINFKRKKLSSVNTECRCEVLINSCLKLLVYIKII